MTDIATRSAASRKGWESRRRREEARAGLDPAIYGPDGTHRGSNRFAGVNSVAEILERLPKG